MGHKSPTHLWLLSGGLDKEYGSSSDSSKLVGSNSKTKVQMYYKSAAKTQENVEIEIPRLAKQMALKCSHCCHVECFEKVFLSLELFYIFRHFHYKINEKRKKS